MLVSTIYYSCCVITRYNIEKWLIVGQTYGDIIFSSFSKLSQCIENNFILTTVLILYQYSLIYNKKINNTEI